MVPWIVFAGAAAGAVTLALAFLVFLLPLPPLATALLYLILGGMFMASVVTLGRLLVIEG